jgi:hypothetical protein
MPSLSHTTSSTAASIIYLALAGDDYTYVSMNTDGCWCDSTFHEKTGAGLTIGDVNCLMDAAAADEKECEFGPCGGDPFHTAVYRLKNTGFVSHVSPKGNSFVAYDVDLSVYFNATWAFRGLGYGIDGALQAGAFRLTLVQFPTHHKWFCHCLLDSTGRIQQRVGVCLR